MSGYGMTVETSAGVRTLGVGDHLWSMDGRHGHVAALTPEGPMVWVYLGAHDRVGQPVLFDAKRWAPALPCDYCDRAPTLVTRETNPGELLCDTCAHDQYTNVSEWCRKITPVVIRTAYRNAYL